MMNMLMLLFSMILVLAIVAGTIWLVVWILKKIFHLEE